MNIFSIGITTFGYIFEILWTQCLIYTIISRKRYIFALSIRKTIMDTLFCNESVKVSPTFLTIQHCTNEYMSLNILKCHINVTLPSENVIFG